MHDMRSVGKSVTSLLVGIALDRKLIAGLDEPVMGYFPQYADLWTPAKDAILVRHLLAMTSGIARRRAHARATLARAAQRCGWREVAPPAPRASA